MLTSLVLCRMFNAAAVEELAKYAGQLGSMDSPGSTKSESSSLAAAWLEAVFPGLNSLGHPLPGESLGGSIVLKAHAYVPIHASLLLQVVAGKPPTALLGVSGQ